jgi:hypothetical protein
MSKVAFMSSAVVDLGNELVCGCHAGRTLQPAYSHHKLIDGPVEVSRLARLPLPFAMIGPLELSELGYGGRIEFRKFGHRGVQMLES